MEPFSGVCYAHTLIRHKPYADAGTGGRAGEAEAGAEVRRGGVSRGIKGPRGAPIEGDGRDWADF